MAGNKIFSDKALDTVSNPEQLDQHIRITKPYVWVIMVGIISLIIGVGIWACTGDVSPGTEINGVIFPAQGAAITVASHDGKVTDVLVKEGQLVEKGDILLVVPDENIVAQIKEKKNATSQELQSLKNQYVFNSFVRADRSGTIDSIASIGDEVSTGDTLSTNVPDDDTSNSREILAYVPYTIAKSINVGDNAEVSLSNAPREEYGYMIGTVTSVGTSVITEESIMKTMGTMKYVSSLNLSSDCVEVRIRINADSSSVSGYEWSNDKGKQMRVDIGEICNVKIVGAPVRPIDLLF